MPLTKDKKRQVVEKVKEVVDSSQSLVFVNFNGLNVSDANELRSKLREQGVGYMVIKKTLMKLALADKSIEGEMPELEGECALAFGSDLTGPAREVYDFHKTHPENLSIMGGVFEGRFMNKAEMEEVANIPSHQVLLGMFVNLINSPIQRLVTGLDQVAQKKAEQSA